MQRLVDPVARNVTRSERSSSKAVKFYPWTVYSAKGQAFPRAALGVGEVY